MKLLSDRIKHVTEACFNGRRIVVFKQRKLALELLGKDLEVFLGEHEDRALEYEMK